MMNIEPIVVHGWKFELANKQLSITSEQDNKVHLELSASAAYSLLDYLYQYREVLHDSAGEEAGEQVEQLKEKQKSNETTDQAIPE